MSCFLDMLLRYLLSDFEMVQVAPIITGINFVFAFHVCCIFIVLLLLLLLLLLSTSGDGVICPCLYPQRGGPEYLSLSTHLKPVERGWP
jgi:hypothetical protein